MPSNEERASSAEIALAKISPSGEGEREAFVDFLANVMHARGVEWVMNAAETAKMHHDAELI